MSNGNQTNKPANERVAVPETGASELSAEELGKVDGGVSTLLSSFTKGPGPMLAKGSDVTMENLLLATEKIDPI